MDDARALLRWSSEREATRSVGKFFEHSQPGPPCLRAIADAAANGLDTGPCGTRTATP